MNIVRRVREGLTIGLALVLLLTAGCGSTVSVESRSVEIAEPEYTYTEKICSYDDGSYFLFRYDGDGNVRQVSYFSEENAEKPKATADYSVEGWELHTAELYGNDIYSWDRSFDEAGNCIRILAYRNSELVEQYDAEYDAEGCRLYERDQHLEGQETLTDYIQEYAYDSENRMVRKSIDYTDYETPSYSYSYTEERTWEGLIAHIIRKDSDGHIIATGDAEYGDFEVQAGINDDGTILNYILYATDGSVQESIINTYDEEGRMTARTTVYVDPENVYLNYEDTAEYSYDAMGKLCHEIHYRDGVPYNEMTITYDETGREIKIVSSTYYEDESGNLIQEDAVGTTEYTDDDLSICIMEGIGDRTVTKGCGGWLSVTEE